MMLFSEGISIICLVFQMSSHSACVWATVLKLGCSITNFDMLFLVMGSFAWSINFNNEIKFMLISSHCF